MEIKIKERKLGPGPHPRSQQWGPRAPGPSGVFPALPLLSPLRNQLGTPAGRRWTEGKLKGIFCIFHQYQHKTEAGQPY